MKSLSNYISEKLLINRNFNNVYISFTKKFGKDFTVESDIDWLNVNDLRKIYRYLTFSTDRHLITNLKEMFDELDVKPVYCAYILRDDDYTPEYYTDKYNEDVKHKLDLYKNVLKFIEDHKNEIDFFYKYDNSTKMATYMFTVNDLKIAISGVKDIRTGHRLDSFNDYQGIIVWRKKQ